jgi:hypothetical protein
MQIRDLPGVGNNPDNKAIRVQFRDCEANAVHGNRPFENHVSRKRFWKSDLDSMIASRRFDGFDPSRGVYMPLHHVPVEPAIRQHRSLQIDYIASFKISQIGSSQCFAQQIESNLGPIYAGDRQAAAI